MGGVAYKLENAKELGEANPGQNVIVKVKNWRQSLTVLINGSLLIVATIVKMIDILTGQNALEPLVAVFVREPEAVANALTVVTQAYTALNLYLRVFKTSQPITLRSNDANPK